MKPLRQRAYRMLPVRWQSWLTARLVERFDPAALRRFQESHRPASLPPRDFNGEVAIVVPCFNHAAYLQSAFTSIARQTCLPAQVVVVEDHSTDDTLPQLQRICRELQPSVACTLLQTPHNSGQAAALNLGIAACTASLIMILNDDDYLMHDAVEATVTILQRHEQLYLLGGTAVHISGAGAPSADTDGVMIRGRAGAYEEIPLTIYQPRDVLGFRHANDLNMTHSGSAFFKAAWSAVGGYYPEKRRRVVAFSDRDFQLRVASLFPVGVAAGTPFAFWRSDSSVDSGRDS